MKKNLIFVLSIGLLSLLMSGIVFAQEERVVSQTGDVYVISAKAGVVSYVEGKVSVIRKDGKSGYLLKDDKLEAGDKVSTDSNAKAEVLLNPGSYLRLAGNSAFEFETTDLNDLRLKITRGSTILEVLAADEFKVAVKLPNAGLELTRSGVFRIDVFADGTGRISVWKGKAFVGADQAELKSGRSAVISGTNAAIAKFDRDNADDLDVWSKLRAKELAQNNARLQRDAMRNSLLNAYNRGGWNAFNSFGLWVFDPIRRMWCFLPFGSGWGSPYGYDYPFNMWYCRMPYYVYTQPNGNGSGGGNGGGTGGGTTTPNVPNATREDRQLRSITPPFQRTNPDGQRVETTSNQTTRDDRNGNSDWNNTRRNKSDDDRVVTPRNDSPRVDTKVDTTPPPTPIIVMPQTTKSNKDN